MKVELLGREGCGLCDEAAELLRWLDIGFERIDIDAVPSLAGYSKLIPVVMVDGREIARAPIEPESLRMALTRARGATSRTI